MVDRGADDKTAPATRSRSHRLLLRQPVRAFPTTTGFAGVPETHGLGTNLDLVGDWCKTATPVTVTMSAMANLAGPTSMSGEFTIPPFQNCGGLVTTNALTLAISGPGSAFSADATPN